MSLLIGLLLVVAGCAGAPDGPPPSNVLRTNIKADPAMIDPITYSELLSGDVIANIYESFAALDAEGNVVPSLATSWEAHEDNRGFLFHLRPDVTFHSGRKLTSADVKWSLEQLLIPGNRGGLNAKYAESIEGAEGVQAGETKELSGITIIDDLTLEVRFHEAEVLFPIYPIFIMDRGVVAEHGERLGDEEHRQEPDHSLSWNGGEARSCG